MLEQLQRDELFLHSPGFPALSLCLSAPPKAGQQHVREDGMSDKQGCQTCLSLLMLTTTQKDSAGGTAQLSPFLLYQI